MRWGAAAIILCSCSLSVRKSDTPLPDVSLEAFQPAIRAEIEKALRQATANADDPQAVGELGMVLHAHQSLAAAEISYRRAHALAPDEFRWQYLLATVQAELGKDSEAAENLRGALRIDPSYGPAKVKLAELLLKSAAFDEAEKLYRQVLSTEARPAPAWYGLGRVYSARGEAEQAAQAFERAIEAYPDYGAAHYALALTYRRLRKTEDARKHFELGEKHKLEMPPTGDRILAEVRGKTKDPSEYLRAGVELDNEGKLAEALAMHLEAVKIDPERVQAHINLISIYGRMGQTDKAVEHYRKALALNKDLPDCHYNYGVLMFQQGNLAGAKAAFARAIEINPFYAKAHHNLGVLLEAEGELEPAAAHYRKALENEPGYRLAHFHLGRLLLARGRAAEAIPHFEQILKPVDQDTPGYLYALAAAYARTGQRNKALACLRQARDRAAEFGQRELLAAIKNDLGKLEAAGKHP